MIPPEGIVVRELCIFSPGGIVDMTMLIHGQRATTPYRYFEIWNSAPPVVGPPSACMFGELQLASGASPTYNVSTNCDMELVNNSFMTPDNRTWQFLPPSPVSLNVLSDQGIAMLGVAPPPQQSVYCSFIRLFGAECDAVFDQLQHALSLGVPTKKMHMDRNAVCYPQ